MVDERGVLWVFQLTTLYLVGVNLFAIDTNIQIPYQYSDRLQDTKMFQKQHHHHLSLYREDRWGTTYDFKSNAGEKKRKKGWGGGGGAVQLRRCHWLVADLKKWSLWLIYNTVNEQIFQFWDDDDDTDDVGDNDEEVKKRERVFFFNIDSININVYTLISIDVITHPYPLISMLNKSFSSFTSSSSSPTSSRCRHNHLKIKGCVHSVYYIR